MTLKTFSATDHSEPEDLFYRLAWSWRGWSAKLKAATAFKASWSSTRTAEAPVLGSHPSSWRNFPASTARRRSWHFPSILHHMWVGIWNLLGLLLHPTDQTYFAFSLTCKVLSQWILIMFTLPVSRIRTADVKLDAGLWWNFVGCYYYPIGRDPPTFSREIEVPEAYRYRLAQEYILHLLPRITICQRKLLSEHFFSKNRME